MRDVGVIAVALELGIETQKPRGASGGAFSCPACNAPRRHTRSRDRRGAAGVRNDGRGWRCFQCDESGDAIDLIAFVLGGARFASLTDSAKTEVREWCTRWLGLDPRLPNVRPMPPRPEAPTYPSPPRYPPSDEVHALWNACARADEAREVAEWLRSRRIDPTAVADADLARALHPSVRLPRWARFRGSDDGFSDWFAGGYLMIAQLVDAQGQVRSVLARGVRSGVEPKSRAASGFERRGLVLACPLTREVLISGARPTWWPDDVPLRFEIAEGEKKWAMRATLRNQELAPACIGIESGSWTDEIAARIPDGSSVFVATDPNDAGARYATTIIRSLATRIATGAVCVELHPHLELLKTASSPTVGVRP